MINLEQLKEILEGSGYFGLRGLSGIHGKAEYQDGEILECSFDDWDNRGVEYNPELDRLDGTAAIGVNEYMDDEEIVEMYKKALNYSDCGKVILISGTDAEAGCDGHETVISYKGDGAKFRGYAVLC
ncbi:MAG: hypothetical protein PHQ35_09495 [Phycisphaerae bacterium]|nr:hypothetical protein [Phycisphaerae bacterium]